MNRTKINFEGSDVMLFWMEIHSVRCVMKIPYSEITLRIANVSQEVCDKRRNFLFARAFIEKKIRVSSKFQLRSF